YCAFDNGGKKVTPVFISRIEDKEGKVIYEGEAKKTKQAISKQTAYYMTRMLKGVVNEGTASRLRDTYKIKGEMAGKTGTTQSQADGWFIGYTPGLVAGAWVGAESPAIHFNSILYGQGASMALPIWAYFMQKCKSDDSFKKYVKGSFNLPKDVEPMPECEPFVKDNLFDKIKNLFRRNPGSKQEKKKRENKK
ncbi:MAG: penicillin-binding transpeptidase domain-containing protein, partial [Bacteroidia bacterium]